MFGSCVVVLGDEISGRYSSNSIWFLTRSGDQEPYDIDSEGSVRQVFQSRLVAVEKATCASTLVGRESRSLYD